MCLWADIKIHCGIYCIHANFVPGGKNLATITVLGALTNASRKTDLELHFFLIVMHCISTHSFFFTAFASWKGIHALNGFRS